MTQQELMQESRRKIGETDQGMNRVEKLVNDTEVLGTEDSGRVAEGASIGKRTSLEVDDPRFAALLSFSIERLMQEPNLVREESTRLQQQLEGASVQQYHTFLEGAQVLTAAGQHGSMLQQQLAGLDEALPKLAQACSDFTTHLGAILQERAKLRQLSDSQATLAQLLEIPQLMDTCIRTENYDEALELEAFVAKLAALHPHGPIVQSLSTQVAALCSTLEQAILSRLAGPLQLAECLRLVGHLRRLGNYDEAGLQREFLSCRQKWLSGLVADLEPANPYDYLKRLTDLVRLHVFDTAMHFQAIFEDDEDKQGDSGRQAGQVLHVWALQQISTYLASLTASLEVVTDGGSLAALVEHAMYCGASLGRVGLDFRALLPPLFERRISALFMQCLEDAQAGFAAALEAHKWLPLPPTSDRSALRREGGQGAEGVDAAFDEQQVTQQLLDHAPLVVLLNGLLLAFNEVRHNVVLNCSDKLLAALESTLTACCGQLSRYAATHGLGANEREVFLQAVKLLREVLCPYIARHWQAMWRTASKLDERAVVEPLQDIDQAVGVAF